ncbi:hypothetical protein Taro_039839, partial [Colocasia esculenta]|nr:hypothetical protein [Colocasia esculenta]
MTLQASSLLFQVCKKLRLVKQALRDWNKKDFGDVANVISTTRAALIEAQHLLADNPSDKLIQDRENSCRGIYLKALETEEMFAKQKSKQQWLTLGDSNTKFFYAAIKARRIHNSIKQCKASDGTILTTDADIRAHALEMDAPPTGGQPSSTSVGCTTAAVTSSSGRDKDRVARMGRSSSSTRWRSRSRGPVEVSSAPRTWVSLFSAPSSSESSHALSFIAPFISEDKKIAICDVEDIEELQGAWDRTIVGYVVDLKTSFMPLSSFIKNRWGVVGFDLHLLENGFFICKMDNEEDVTRILEGFWSIRGHPMILRRWEKGLRMELESLKNIPVWVSIHSLPIHLWSKKFISKLCSTIGEPLFMDRLTAERRRLSFARACVMVSSEVELPNYISYKDLDGTQHDLQISYSWKPRRCGGCGLFGHLHGQCKTTPKQIVNCSQQIYRPKEKPASSLVTDMVRDTSLVGMAGLRTEDMAGDTTSKVKLAASSVMEKHANQNRFAILGEKEIATASEEGAMANEEGELVIEQDSHKEKDLTLIKGKNISVESVDSHIPTVGNTGKEIQVRKGGDGNELVGKIQHNPSDYTLIAKEKEIKKEYIKAMENEEAFYKQKSKQNWLSLGDSNTKFFYASFKARKAINSITRCKDSNGGGTVVFVFWWYLMVVGKFSVSNVWNLIREHNQKVGWDDWVWKGPTVQRFSLTCWQAVMHKLPTLNNLKKRGFYIPSRCVLCCNDEECEDHLFFACPYSQSVWREMLQRMSIRRQPRHSILAEMHALRVSFKNDGF